MSETALQLKTVDGLCPCYAYSPPGGQPAPAAIFFMDGLGIRPDLRAMAERLASNGFFALLPDLYHRAGPLAFDPATVMSDPAARARMMELVRSVTSASVRHDTQACLDYLAGEPRARDSGRVGCVGYCMGGSAALRAAASFPDQIAAAASIHGANLATDAPDSPHLGLGKVRGAVYVAVAGIDPWLQPGETERLRAALVAAGVRHEVEDYPGVQHGFAANGTPMYDRAAAERHWEKVLALFRAELS